MLEQIRIFFTSNIIFLDFEWPFSLLGLILKLILPIAGSFFLLFFIRMGLRAYLRATETSEKVQERILRWVRILSRFVFIIGIIIFTSWLFGPNLLKIFEHVYNFLNKPFFTAGNTEISIFSIMAMLVLFYIASWTGKISRTFIDHQVLAKTALDNSKKFTISALMRYSIMSFIILIGLSIIGIDLSSLAVIFGVLGIGLGFGLQNVVSNFFSGLVILFTRPIKEGDRVFLNGLDGTIIQVRILSTIINTPSNESIIIPNSDLVNRYVHNYSYSDRQIVIVNTVQVSYQSDLEKVKVVLLRLSKDNPYFWPNQQSEFRVESFDESGITVSIRTWITDAVHKFQASSWTNMEIWRRFREENIQIPFPQRVVHHYGESSTASKKEET